MFVFLVNINGNAALQFYFSRYWSYLCNFNIKGKMFYGGNKEIKAPKRNISIFHQIRDGLKPFPCYYQLSLVAKKLHQSISSLDSWLPCKVNIFLFQVIVSTYYSFCKAEFQIDPECNFLRLHQSFLKWSMIDCVNLAMAVAARAAAWRVNVFIYTYKEHFR